MLGSRGFHRVETESSERLPASLLFSWLGFRLVAAEFPE